MKKLFLLCFLLSTGIFAVTAQSDPYKSLKKWSETHPSFEADFTLTYTLPDNTTQKFNGNWKQLQDDWSMSFDGKSWHKTDSTLWVYDPEIEEVYIYDEKDNEKNFTLSPVYFMDQVERGDLEVYYEQLHGRSSPSISFKPRKDAEFFKARISTKPDHQPEIMEVFFRDGVHAELVIDSLNTQVKLSKRDLTFDKEGHPDVYIEDLRL